MTYHGRCWPVERVAEVGQGVGEDPGRAGAPLPDPATWLVLIFKRPIQSLQFQFYNTDLPSHYVEVSKQRVMAVFWQDWYMTPYIF